MREITFTFEWYDELLNTLVEQRYSCIGFDHEIAPETVFLRHDVDWSPRRAVRMAEIEAEHGVTATYFFLVTSPFYNVMNREVRERIEQIDDLGHEIGLHLPC